MATSIDFTFVPGSVVFTASAPAGTMIKRLGKDPVAAELVTAGERIYVNDFLGEVAEVGSTDLDTKIRTVLSGGV